jgi:hypothetical protein
MRTLEAAILAGAKAFFCNSKLRQKDILEWRTGEIKPHEGEVVGFVHDPGVHVAILAKDDKRKAPREVAGEGQHGEG